MTTHNSQYSAETTHPDKQESSPAPTAQFIALTA